MDISSAINIIAQMLIVTLKISAPVLLIGMAVGLIIAVFQAATQIHEQTLTFVPKLIAVGVIFFVAGSYMLETLIAFMRNMFTLMIK